MNSFEELLRIVSDTKVDSKTYVYFDQETGKIEKIGGKSDPKGLSFITVDSKIVKPILSAEKSLDDYIVEYDITKKQLSVKELKRPETEDERSLLTFKEILKTQKTKKIDVLLQQDFKNKCWAISLSEKIKEQFHDESAYIRSNMFFSVTKKGNPNILYRTISFPISDLIKQDKLSVPFECDFEFDKLEVSVYTSSYFDVYKYEVLDEEI